MTAPLRYSEWVRKPADGEAAILFAGPETLLRDQALERIKDRVLGSGESARLGHERFTAPRPPWAT